MTAKEKIEELRAELHRHNYNYYVLNTPEISDKEFDDKMCIRDRRYADAKSKGISNASMSDGDILRELVFKILH